MDVLADRLIHRDLCQVCLLMILCDKHMKFDALAKLLLNDRLKFLLCLGIIRIKPAERCLELYIQYRLACLSVVFRDRLQKCLLKSCRRLTDDHLPAGYDLLQILRGGFLRWCCRDRGCFLYGCSRTLDNDLLHRTLIDPLFQHTDTVKDRIQICLHCRTAELDQRDLHQNSFLCCETDLV